MHERFHRQRCALPRQPTTATGCAKRGIVRSLDGVKATLTDGSGYSQYPVTYHPGALCSPCSSDAFLWRAVVRRHGSTEVQSISGYTVNIRLYGTLVHFVAHLAFQEIYSLTTATSCRLLDRTNEMRSFCTIVRCCSLVRPQRSRSSQLYGRVPYNWDAYNRILTV